MLRSTKGNFIEATGCGRVGGVLFDLLHGAQVVGVATFFPAAVDGSGVHVGVVILSQLYIWMSWLRDSLMMPPCRRSTRCTVDSFWVS